MNPDNIQTITAIATKRLTAVSGDTPLLDAQLLLGHVLGCNRTWLMMNPQHHLTVAQTARFDALLRRREACEPVAYLVGQQEFFALDFWVSPHVLIPRPETELLVEHAIEWVNRQKRPATIVDVGTGSGCIAVSLAHHLPHARLIALDVSAAALNVARQNAARHQLTHRVTFVQSNLLQSLTGPIDLIVSNPPYISQAEFTSGQVSPGVRHYEPSLALLGGGTKGLSIVERLLIQAAAKIAPQGGILIEIGARQGEAAIDLARKHLSGVSACIKQDLAGRDRLLVVQA